VWFGRLSPPRGSRLARRFRIEAGGTKTVTVPLTRSLRRRLDRRRTTRATVIAHDRLGGTVPVRRAVTLRRARR